MDNCEKSWFPRKSASKSLVVGGFGLPSYSGRGSLSFPAETEVSATEELYRGASAFPPAEAEAPLRWVFMVFAFKSGRRGFSLPGESGSFRYGMVRVRSYNASSHKAKRWFSHS